MTHNDGIRGRAGAVTAAFAEHLDALPGRLQADFRCRVRDLTATERARLTCLGVVTHAYAVTPSDPGCASLLVTRYTDEHGVPSVVMAFGLAATKYVPDSYDTVADLAHFGLVEEVEELVDAVLYGCREFSRPSPDGGPSMEEGCETLSGTSWSTIEPGLRQPFEREWAPWGEREELAHAQGVST